VGEAPARGAPRLPRRLPRHRPGDRRGRLSADAKPRGGGSGDETSPPDGEKPQGSFFTRFASGISKATGNPFAFVAATLLIVVWIVTGPIFHFSDTWQLVINTGTTIITFLMVFLIQHTQNRDTLAMQLKLDELIRSTQGAHLVMLDLEQLTEEELEDIRCRYEDLAARARAALRKGESDAGTPEVEATSSTRKGH
jgi:low affinity Fe/Cu permease